VVFEGLTDEEVALLQASENIHEPVPPEEAAAFYANIWQKIKQSRPDFSLRDFCRAIGRSEKVVRNALRFVLLPETVRLMVQEGVLVYGAAVEISRLHDILPEHLLKSWAVDSVASGERVKDVKEKVDAYVEEVNSGQKSLFETDQAYQKEERRKRIDSSLTWAFLTQTSYLERLLTLLERGDLGAEDVQWLRRQPRQALLRVVNTLERLLNQAPLMEQFSVEEVEQMKLLVRLIVLSCSF